MEDKKFVENLYRDPETGMEFCEDIRGNIYCLGRYHVDTHGEATTNITNNYYRDNYNYSELVVLQTTLRGFNWSSLSSFNRVKNSFQQGTFLEYSIPTGKELHILNITASQSRRGDDDKLGLSFLGLYVNNNLLITFPFTEDLDIKLESPIKLPSSFFEVKFLPSTSKVDLGVTIIGYTIQGG